MTGTSDSERGRALPTTEGTFSHVLTSRHVDKAEQDATFFSPLIIGLELSLNGWERFQAQNRNPTYQAGILREFESYSFLSPPPASDLKTLVVAKARGVGWGEEDAASLVTPSPLCKPSQRNMDWRAGTCCCPALFSKFHTSTDGN